jgi:hypothetical protein
MRKTLLITCTFIVVAIGAIAGVIKARETAISPGKHAEATISEKYVNSEYGFSLVYPADWTLREVSGAALTPFGVLFAKDDLESWHGEPGEYPDQFVNIALYRAPDITADEYAKDDLRQKKMSSKLDATQIGGRSGFRQSGQFIREGFTYVSAYTKHREHIIIIESIVKDEYKDALTSSFDQIVGSIQLSD